MSWLPPPPQKLGGLRELPSSAPRPDPVLEMLAASEENVDDREWQGGSSGAMLPTPPPQPQAPPQPVGLPPPEWAGQIASSPNVPAQSPEEPLSALEQMHLDAGDVEEPGAFQAPITTPPLERPVPPAPDWELEQKQREPSEAPEPIIPPAPWSPTAKGSP